MVAFSGIIIVKPAECIAMSRLIVAIDSCYLVRSAAAILGIVDITERVCYFWQSHCVIFVVLNEKSYRVEVVPLEDKRKNPGSEDSRAVGIPLTLAFFVASMSGVPEESILEYANIVSDGW